MNRKLETLSYLSFFLILPFNNIITLYNAYYELSNYNTLKVLVFLTAIPLILLFFISFFDKKRYKKNIYINILFYFFIIYSIYVVISNITRTPFDYMGVSVFSYNISILLKYVLYFIIGITLPNPNKYRKITIFIFIILTINILIHTDFLGMKLRSGYSYTHAAMYLFLADSYVLSSALVLAVLNKKSHLYILIIISIFCLYILGSRASLYSYLLAIIMIYFLINNRIYSLVTVVFLVLLLPFALMLADSSMIADNRMLRLIMGFEDASELARNRLLSNGLASIWANFFTGDYAGQVRDTGFIGSYIHNYLSIWRQFGFIPFAITVYLMYKLLAKILSLSEEMKSLMKKTAAKKMNYWFVITSVFLLIEIITSRSYGYPYIWLCIGLLANKEFSQKNIQYKT